MRDSHAITEYAGFSIVELMISMAVGLLISLASISLLLSSKNAYTAQDDYVEIQQTGRYALEAITRAIHQAGYENWDQEDAPAVTDKSLSANISGLDARSLKSALPALESPITAAINGSDVLAVRYFGSGSGSNGDGTIINCAGFGVAATTQDAAEEERGWSIFYVANDSVGEPELRCKYKRKNGWSSEAIARGVESFQILYGVDTDGDGLANQFLRAVDITALDDALMLSGSTKAARISEKNAKTYWKKVVAIKMGLLIRGWQSSRVDDPTHFHDLLGQAYSDAYAAMDSGVRIYEGTLPNKIRSRVRKVFSTTIRLRNQEAGAAT
ncbi:MAG: PilW family protein [Burkholderiales bacterium]|nr:PilW family protein [Burkholderiales bacterium]